MKTIFIDASTLTGEIIMLLIEKYPYGYAYSDIVSYKDSNGKYIRVIQVDNLKTTFSVKIGQYLDDLMDMFSDDEDHLKMSKEDFDFYFYDFIN